MWKNNELLVLYILQKQIVLWIMFLLADAEQEAKEHEKARDVCMSSSNLSNIIIKSEPYSRELSFCSRDVTWFHSDVLCDKYKVKINIFPFKWTIVTLSVKPS